MDYRAFTKKELVEILDVIQSTVACKDEKDVRGLLGKVKELVCGDYSVCGLGKGGPDGLAATPTVINGNYPEEWLRTYGESRLYLKDPIIWHNFQHPGSQLWEDTYSLYAETVSRDFISGSRDFGLCYGVSGGLCDTRMGVSSIFTFAGKGKRFGAHHKKIMDMLSPHLHQALARLCKEGQTAGGAAGAVLSEREKEVLRWVKEGKTNWEISMILNISERTVKFHVQNIERKLNAVNKAHAIAIALDQNLVT